MLVRFAFLFFIFSCIFAHSSAFSYEGKTISSLCPSNILETKTITAKYLGWNYSDSLGGGILELELQNVFPFFVFATESEAEAMLGKVQNVYVQITYDIIQEYSHKTSLCEILPVLKAGKHVPQGHVQLSSSSDAQNETIFYTNTVEGVYDGYREGPDFGNVMMLIAGQKHNFICDREHAEKIFGKNAKGKSFLLTYDVKRTTFHGFPIFNIAKSAKQVTHKNMTASINSISNELIINKYATNKAGYHSTATIIQYDDNQFNFEISGADMNARWVCAYADFCKKNNESFYCDGTIIDDNSEEKHVNDFISGIFTKDGLKIMSNYFPFYYCGNGGILKGDFNENTLKNNKHGNHINKAIVMPIGNYEGEDIFGYIVKTKDNQEMLLQYENNVDILDEYKNQWIEIEYLGYEEFFEPAGEFTDFYTLYKINGKNPLSIAK